VSCPTAGTFTAIGVTYDSGLEAAGLGLQPRPVPPSGRQLHLSAVSCFRRARQSARAVGQYMTWPVFRLTHGAEALEWPHLWAPPATLSQQCPYTHVLAAVDGLQRACPGPAPRSYRPVQSVGDQAPDRVVDVPILTFMPASTCPSFSQKAMNYYGPPTSPRRRPRHSSVRARSRVLSMPKVAGR